MGNGIIIPNEQISISENIKKLKQEQEQELLLDSNKIL